MRKRKYTTKLSRVSRRKNRKERNHQLMSDYDQAIGGHKKSAEDSKQQFSEIETLVFDLDISKIYRHRIEHYSGKDGLIVFDEQFLLDENDDPDKVLQELKKTAEIKSYRRRGKEAKW